jgi:hypothetical protein
VRKKLVGIVLVLVALAMLVLANLNSYLLPSAAYCLIAIGDKRATVEALLGRNISHPVRSELPHIVHRHRDGEPVRDLDGHVQLVPVVKGVSFIHWKHGTANVYVGFDQNDEVADKHLSLAYP